MSNFEKKTISIVSVIIGALILLFLVLSNSSSDAMSIIGSLLIPAVAGGLIYLINVFAFKDAEISQEILDRMTEKDYLKQMADDIHIIKIVIIVFAIITALSMLISVFSLLALVNVFSKF